MSTLNFAQKTNFICGCSLLPNIEFYLQSVSLPGISFNLSETKSLNLTHYVASTDHTYGTLQFEILIDEDFKIYDLFFNEILKSKSLTNPTYAQREFNIWIQVFNNKGNLLFTENFYNCMIDSLGDVSLLSTDSSIVNTVSVTLKFDWLDIVHDGISEEDRKSFGIYPPKEKCDCKCKNAKL